MNGTAVFNTTTVNRPVVGFQMARYKLRKSEFFEYHIIYTQSSGLHSFSGIPAFHEEISKPNPDPPLEL